LQKDISNSLNNTQYFQTSNKETKTFISRKKWW